MIGLICLIFTLGIYAVSKRIYAKRPKVYLSPLLITPAIVILI